MSSQKLSKDFKLGCERFRVLIIGDPNTGKTTILKKVHKAGGKPTARDAIGNQVCHISIWRVVYFVLKHVPIDRYRLGLCGA